MELIRTGCPPNRTTWFATAPFGRKTYLLTYVVARLELY